MSIIIPILIVIAIFIIVFFGFIWKLSSSLLHPEPEELNRKHYVFFEPSELKLKHEDVSFKTVDDVQIKGWYVPVRNSKRAIILVHGIFANRREGLRWISCLKKAGYSTLVFDLRNHGESGKSFTTMGAHEKNDVLAAVEFLSKEKKIQKIGLFGISLGGATGIGAMAEDKRIKAGIFEAVFANFGDLLADLGKKNYKFPRFPIVPLLMMIYSLRGKFKAKKANPEDIIGQIAPRPVFIIHGIEDDFIKIKHGERLYHAAGEPKKMWRSSCAVHAEAWQDEKDLIEGVVVKFFNRYLK